ncbi:MAG: glycosyltransferase [Chryseobacterium sp.]|nr:glycosyltransferase [Chryseobacterium sp.]
MSFHGQITVLLCFFFGQGKPLSFFITIYIVFVIDENKILKVTIIKYIICPTNEFYYDMKRKILFIYYQNIKAGGIAKVLANLANELIKEAYQVEILFLMREHEDFYPLDSRIKKHYVDSFSFWTFRLCQFNRKYLRFIPRLDNINTYIYQLGVTILMNNWLKQNHMKYDLIISCWYKLSCTLALNKKVSHKTIAWEHASHKVGGVFWNKLKVYYENLQNIICLNHDDYLYYKGINPQTSVIGNMMDSPIEDQYFIPKENKENLITMIARLEQEKNVLEFLEIIKESELPVDWQIKIIGDGSQMPILKEYIENNSLSNVFLLGQLDPGNVRSILSRSKISCLTSLTEAFGVVLIEAMFSSNALITYNCPGGPSEIVNKQNGFLISAGDKEDFKDKLK